MDEQKLICCKCNVELVTKNVTFQYVGYNFSTDMPRCPSCGQVYIPEEVATGKMADVEISLEDK